MDAVYRIFMYIRQNLKKDKGRIVLNGKMLNIDFITFDNTYRDDWKDFYSEAHRRC